MAAKSPTEFYRLYNGQTIDYDNAYGVQCVDGFKVGCVYLGVPVKPCPNNWAESYWTCLDSNGNVVNDMVQWQNSYFYRIEDPSQFRDGDWVVWPRGCKSHPSSHIAMYYQGMEFGERQYEDARGFCLKATNFSDASGALRWKGFVPKPGLAYGRNTALTINNHVYDIYHQNPETEFVTIAAAGINKLANITDLDIPGYDVMSKITGANYFQMRDDAADPYGTTYGDLSAPYNGVWTEVPNQDTTLYYDIDTGKYGDCTGVSTDKNHSIFSPSVVYPEYGNFQYARMVGVDHVNVNSRYCFSIKMNDGSYVNGIALQEMTPKQIAEDFRNYDICTIAFLDGGGSANAGAWNPVKKTFEYIRNTGRATPCAVVIALKRSVSLQDPVTETPNNTTQEEPMPNNDIQEPVTTPEPTTTPSQVIYVPVKDEEATAKIESLTETVAKRFLSVKSVVTIVLTTIFGILAIRGSISTEQFMSIFTMCISFFFGYSFEKKNSDGGGGK